ncbi:MAG: holo-ACP synthase [Pseudomonadota bacterium]
MIYGVGTDIVQIGRLQQALVRNARFASRILGPQELDVFHARHAQNAVRALRYLATRFAAKEAFSKALGLGMRAPMSWQAAQTLNDADGKPVLAYSGALAQFMREQGLLAQVSVSDEAEYGVAFVIVTSTASP